VKEISLRKGIFQRLYGLGTIYLATLATGSSYGTDRSNWFWALGFGNISASGVGVRDIPNPDVEYDRIRRIVDANNSTIP